MRCALVATVLAACSETTADGMPDGSLDGQSDSGQTHADASNMPPRPAQDSWGPDILGLADDVDPDGAAADVAFGVFWDPALSTLVYDDGGCVAVLNDAGVIPRRDVGDIVVIGGSGSDPLQLATNADRYYYLGDGAADPWAPGDALSATVQGAALGPVEVPTAFTSDNFDALTTASRSEDLVLEFEGSSSTHVAASLGLGGSYGNLMLVCLGRADTGSYAIPAGALDAIDAEHAEVSIKFSPTNLVQVGDIALFAAGTSVTRTLTLRD